MPARSMTGETARHSIVHVVRVIRLQPTVTSSRRRAGVASSSGCAPVPAGSRLPPAARRGVGLAETPSSRAGLEVLMVERSRDRPRRRRDPLRFPSRFRRHRRRERCSVRRRGIRPASVYDVDVVSAVNVWGSGSKRPSGTRWRTGSEQSPRPPPTRARSRHPIQERRPPGSTRRTRAAGRPSRGGQNRPPHGVSRPRRAIDGPHDVVVGRSRHESRIVVLRTEEPGDGVLGPGGSSRPYCDKRCGDRSIGAVALRRGPGRVLAPHSAAVVTDESPRSRARSSAA
jgi:hypothetical protein